MDYKTNTKEKLFIELETLQDVYDSLFALYSKGLDVSKKTIVDLFNANQTLAYANEEKSRKAAEEDIINSYNLLANCSLTKPIDLNRFFEVVKPIENFWLTLVKLPKNE